MYTKVKSAVTYLGPGPRSKNLAVRCSVIDEGKNIQSGRHYKLNIFMTQRQYIKFSFINYT